MVNWRWLCADAIAKINQSCRTTIFLSVVILHLALNLQFNGPVYLHDEIGYLSNAAFFTGSTADAASSYYAGYSIFLIPAFALFNDPWWIWKAIVATNAILFGSAYLIAYEVLAILSPLTSSRQRLAWILISALYPAYLTGSGYSFALPGQVAVFMFVAWCLLQYARTGVTSWALAHSIASGFLFWIHPTGAAAALASIATVLLWSWKESKWVTGATCATITLVLVALYIIVVQPCMVAAMTPAGFAPLLHYPSASGLLELFTSFSGVAEIFVRSYGIVAYLGITTVGFALWGMAFSIKKASGLFTSIAGLPESYLSLFCLLSMAGILAMGSATFSPGFAAIVDTFFYARYAESVVLPFLLFGMVFRSTDRYFLAAIAIILSVVLLRLNPEFMASPQFGDWRHINFINATGLWPLALPIELGVLPMFAVGALAVAIVGWSRPRISYACLTLVFLVSCINALRFHAFQYPAWGNPGSMPKLISGIWPHKTCVGIDPDGLEDENYKFNLFRYYLHSFDFKRVSSASWLSHCDGPVLTFKPSAYAGPEAEVIAKDKHSALTLVARKDIRSTLEFSDLYTARNDPCLTVACTEMRAGQLLSQTGKMEHGGRRSNGSVGFMVYGPYTPLAAGNYTASIETKVDTPDDAYFDVVANSGPTAGAKTLAKVFVKDLIIRSDSKSVLKFHFRTDAPIDRFELRLYVTSRTDITFFGYTVRPNAPLGP